MRLYDTVLAAHRTAAVNEIIWRGTADVWPDADGWVRRAHAQRCRVLTWAIRRYGRRFADDVRAQLRAGVLP